MSTLVAVELGVTNGSNAGDGGRSDEPHQMALSATTGWSVPPPNFPLSGHPQACHWITRLARRSNDLEIFRPISPAAFKLITSSNMVGCSTGNSAGLAPVKILSR